VDAAAWYISEDGRTPHMGKSSIQQETLRGIPGISTLQLRPRGLGCASQNYYKIAVSSTSGQTRQALVNDVIAGQLLYRFNQVLELEDRASKRPVSRAAMPGIGNSEFLLAMLSTVVC
jgi:hypothetical protein